MSRIWARLLLRWYGVCPKHLTERGYYESLSYSYGCALCDQEKRLRSSTRFWARYGRKKARIEAAKRIMAGAPPVEAGNQRAEREGI